MIQIFGTPKNSDTRKAERWFKERRIQFQSINLSEKQMSPRELESVIQAVGGIEKLINTKGKNYTSISYLEDADKPAKLLDNPELMIIPVVRNGKLSTAGFLPAIWKTWIDS